jgi:hypothetical protein
MEENTNFDNIAKKSTTPHDTNIECPHCNKTIDYDALLNKNLKSSMFADNKLRPDIEKLIRYTIKEWSSLKELENPTHEEVVQRWLNSDCKEWIQNNCK